MSIKGIPFGKYESAAVITGAAGGMGRIYAGLLAENGYCLIMVDISGENLAKAADEVRGLVDKSGLDPDGKFRILTLAQDLSQMDAASKVGEAAAGFGVPVDILINNAALWRCWASFLDTPTEEWKKFIDINVMGTVYFTKAVLPSMLEHSWGRIINVASVAGVYGNAMMAHYSATKGAIIAFTKALAKEVTDKGVLVNSVSPGSVSPSENYNIDHTEESQLSFMGRTGSDRENANLICFLASDEASYISAQNIQIDGCRKKQ